MAVGSLAPPAVAWAQQGRKMPSVGILHSAIGPRAATVDIARQGLRELGYTDGRLHALEDLVHVASRFPSRWSSVPTASSS